MRRVTGIALAVFLSVTVAVPAAGGPIQTTDTAPGGSQTSPSGRFVVGFDRDWSGTLRERLLDLGITGVAPLPTIDAAVVTGPQRAIERLAARPEVSYLEPDARAHFNHYQTSEHTGEGAVKEGRPPLRDPLTGKGVTVAVVDTGVDPNHPDLSGQVIDSLNFEASGKLGLALATAERDAVAESAPPPQTAATTHGLSVGGVLAGTGAAAQGGIDMEGVAPGARIVDFAVCCSGIALTQAGKVESWGSDFLFAYDYMIRHRDDPEYPGGIRIATNQWGFLPTDPYPREALTDMLRKAVDVGITVVFSAGNAGPAPNTVDEPHGLVDEIIVTGVSCPAIDGYDAWKNDGAGGACGRHEITVYSSRGEAVDIVAPAAGIWAAKYPTAVGNGDVAEPRPGFAADPVATANNRAFYGVFGGTSAAAPYVAGTIALMLEADPTLTPGEIDDILRRTARDEGPSGEDDAWGAGEIDVFGAAKQAVLLARRGRQRS